VSARGLGDGVNREILTRVQSVAYVRRMSPKDLHYSDYSLQYCIVYLKIAKKTNLMLSILTNKK
jgi:hypothetical protein